MLKQTLIGIIFFKSLTLGGLFIEPASAGNASDNTGGNLSDVTGGNLSDVTGGNLSDVTGGKVSDLIGKKRYTFTKIGKLNPEIVNEGKQIAADLIEAYKNGNSTDIRSLLNNRATVSKKAEKFLQNITRKVQRGNSQMSKNRLW